MSLSIGIVGLPNVGKSTLFNALVRSHQADCSNYPFCTIKPNVGIVEVPDERLEKLGQILGTQKIIPETLKFIDIAGLVKNAHQGEGLGNQFLHHIREVDAVIHVVRAFENPMVSHVHNKIDPEHDIEIINIELELAGIKKPTLHALNVSERQLNNKTNYESPRPPCKQGVAGGRIMNYGEFIFISVKLESELIELPEKEQKEYLRELGLEESVLPRLIRAAHKLLGLITFYTLKTEQIQSWAIPQNTKTPQAAGKVHTDMERGFIAAEVISCNKLIAVGSWKAAREKGLLLTEGKDYAVQDGDVINFRFNARK